ncbi:MAG: putative toxin-antitoxin system toxin component, PIN family [Chitinophagaceae bacterium]|nr:putative toxin-antitoxin system toxin component, PIN family [Chitinophagaceae bacterium]
MANKIVIDTNALISSLSRKSVYHRLIKMVLNGEIDVFVTDEIMFEYEEKLVEKYAANVANNFLSALKELPNVQYVKVFYNWNLLNDGDDNKFVDCYVSANAQLLITNDNGYNVLKQITFPPINIMKLEDFLQMN